MVDRLSLDIAPGEFLVLLGPSGCGKSTVLRMIAGLEEITEGELLLDGEYANDLLPSERDMAMVFQNFALYPNMTSRGNIGFPLRIETPGEDPRARVDATARMLGIEDLLDRFPSQLSGGERQRVAMGRAIARHPSAFLMDEPLSNLDAKLRNHLRAEISSLTRELGVTTVYVTHDQAEAMSLGDRVAVLRGGVLQQVGTPRVGVRPAPQRLRRRLHRHPAHQPAARPGPGPARRRDDHQPRQAVPAAARTPVPGPPVAPRPAGPRGHRRAALGGRAHRQARRRPPRRGGRSAAWSSTWSSRATRSSSTSTPAPGPPSYPTWRRRAPPHGPPGAADARAARPSWSACGSARAPCARARWWSWTSRRTPPPSPRPPSPASRATWSSAPPPTSNSATECRSRSWSTSPTCSSSTSTASASARPRRGCPTWRVGLPARGCLASENYRR